MLKFNDVTMRDMLTGLTETGNVFDPAATYIGVYSAIDDQGGDTVMADVTEGTGALATRVVVTAWSDPHKLNDGRWAVDGPLAEFAPASSAQAQALAGFFLASAAVAGNLKAWDSFPETITLPSEFYTLKVIVQLAIDPSGNWGVAVIIDG